MFIQIILVVFAVSAKADSSVDALCDGYVSKSKEFVFRNSEKSPPLPVGMAPNGAKYIHKMNFSVDVDTDPWNHCPIENGDTVQVTGLFKEQNIFRQDQNFIYLIPTRCLEKALDKEVSYLFELDCKNASQYSVLSIYPVDWRNRENLLMSLLPPAPNDDVCEICKCC